jgi:hypothetical protein
VLLYRVSGPLELSTVPSDPRISVESLLVLYPTLHTPYQLLAHTSRLGYNSREDVPAHVGQIAAADNLSRKVHGQV